MHQPWTIRPERGEYGEFHVGYVGEVPEGDIVETLEREGERAVGLWRSVPEAKTSFAYVPGKWTIAEVVAHVNDSERVFAYRALRFGRGDPTPLASFDQEAWLPHAHAGERRFADLIDEFRAVRGATLHLFRSFAPEEWLSSGEASGIQVTVRALGWIVAGHELHHRRVLRERYGVGAGAG